VAVITSHPAEIEGHINQMPSVAESALVGVPHPDFGEVGVAVVVRKPGAALEPEEIVAGLKSRLAELQDPEEMLCGRRSAAQYYG
jgi:malonyl-CoA/methylmalonyl-CoA synthetase